ncbi:PTS glucose transporter subunit IIA [Erysipelothrix inopinata]|uniref:PTS glucose transporter subunit IIA n=1 Tax=Erysipelothrix inopinata TaxID=225084 RepID=A0A7G9S1B4_9FIRM|nr:PTS glucose transporter subunit IIA [Erysipelothrix inopinata]QNN61639.1 PTS glucose transporter subunit IIA [Erysipelothrix inopinata]
MFSKIFKPKPLDLVSPMMGKVIAMEHVNDPVFSEKAMGDGFAIEFTDGNVFAPVDGEVVALFPTNHAIGIRGNDRNEFLIHIGLDTVNFKGEGFKAHVEMGQQVKKGDLLLEVNHKFFKDNDVDMTSPVIVTNLNGRRVILLKDGENVESGTPGIIAIKV